MKNIIVSFACTKPYYVSGRPPITALLGVVHSGETAIVSSWEAGFIPEEADQLSTREIYQSLYDKVTDKILNLRQLEETELKASERSNLERLKQGICMGFDTYLRASTDVIRRCIKVPGDLGDFQFSMSLHHSGLPAGYPLFAVMLSTDCRVTRGENGQIHTVRNDNIEATKCTLQVFTNGMVHDPSDGQLYTYIEEAVYARIKKAQFELMDQ